MRNDQEIKQKIKRKNKKKNKEKNKKRKNAREFKEGGAVSRCWGRVKMKRKIGGNGREERKENKTISSS